MQSSASSSLFHSNHAPQHLLTAEQKAELQVFTESLERFCDTEIEPHYRDWEKAGLVSRELFRKMGENGYLCADVPEQYGGPGASVHFSFAVVEVLAPGLRRVCGRAAAGAQRHHPPYLLHCGTEAQRAILAAAHGQWRRGGGDWHDRARRGQ